MAKALKNKFNPIIKAVNITNKIKFKELKKQLTYDKEYESNYEVVFKIDNGFIILYTFGVYTLINLMPKDELDFKCCLEKLIPDFQSSDLTDSFNIEVDPETDLKVEHNKCVIPEFKLEYLRILSLVLAESVAMDAFEDNTADILAESLKYSRELKHHGKYPKNRKRLLKFIGFASTARQEILSNLYISDTPDDAWDDPALEKFFLKLKDMFDLEPRFRTLNMSLNAIQENIDALIDLLHVSKSVRLEWTIIILIAIEIVLTLIKY